MFGNYINKMFKGKTENKEVEEEETVDARIERRHKKRILLPDIPNRFIKEHKALRKDSNPVTRAAFVGKMTRLYNLKVKIPAKKAWADNLMMFIEYVKKTLPKEK